MSRKDLYSKIEKLEGGEAIRDALKELFQGDDKKLQDQVDVNSNVKSELSTLKESFEELKTKSEGTVPKTELDKVEQGYAERLEAMEKKWTDAEELVTQNAKEKRDGEISSHFSKAVIDSFGAKNAERDLPCFAQIVRM